MAKTTCPGTEYDKAIADYNQAIQINPQDAETYFHRAIVYSVLGNLKQTQTDLQHSAHLFQEQKNPEGYQRAINALKRFSK